MLKRSFRLLCLVLVCMGSPVHASAESLASVEFIQELPLKSVENKQVLEIVIESQKRCMFGDLDLINLEIQHAQEPLITQFSLEIFQENGLPIIGKRVDTKSSSVLGKYSFDLSNVSKPVLAGLYICSYIEGDARRSCSSFPQKSFDSMFSPYQMKMDEAVSKAEKEGELKGAPFHLDPDRKNSGHVYFFRFFILANGRAYTPVKAMNAQRYNTFFEKAESLGVNTQVIQDDIVQRSRSLGSLPLAVRDGTLSITLPYFASKKCRE